MGWLLVTAPTTRTPAQRCHQRPSPPSLAGRKVVQLAPFYDDGIGWNRGRATPLNFDLSSVGIGLRWLIGSGTVAELYYGCALHRARLGNFLQDKGVSLRIVAGVF